MRILIHLFLFLLLTNIAFSQSANNHDLMDHSNAPNDFVQQTFKNVEEIRASQPSNHQRSAAPVLFEWPLQLAPGLDFPGYYIINNYVDIDPDTTIMDYACGSRAYNGHNGIDIDLRPYVWNMKREDQVQIIAAADGVVCSIANGMQYDESCQGVGDGYTNGCVISGPGWGNAVAILHGDSIVTMYAHMKAGSMNHLQVGDVINSGDYLGLVGSSGNSSWPHLHFEVRNTNSGNIIDPYHSDCSPGTESYWLNQKHYYDEGINRIETQSQLFIWPDTTCRQNFTTFIKNIFEPGDDIFFTLHLRHHLRNTFVNLQVLNADGTNANLFSNTFTRTTGAYHWALASPQYSTQIPSNFPPGKYIYRATYHTLYHGVQTVDHEFWVQDACPLFRILVGAPTIDYYYNGINYVNSYQTLNSGLEFLFRSENEIVFKQGFHAKTGVKLEAEIDDSCAN